MAKGTPFEPRIGPPAQDCDKVCWLDCDILFKNDAWLGETAELLEKYIAVQPFERVARLPQGVYDLSEGEIKNLGKHQVVSSFIHKCVNKVVTSDEPGFVWAARRSFVQKVRFHDALPTGGQDTILACSFVNDTAVERWLRLYSTDGMKEDQDRYVTKVRREIQGSSYYTSGTILHLWHGSAKDRLYVMRWKVLRAFSFSPSHDIRIDRNGIWEWASDKPGLHRAIREYFEIRNEEGKSSVIHSSLWEELMATQRKLKIKEQRLNAIKAGLPFGILRIWDQARSRKFLIKQIEI